MLRYMTTKKIEGKKTAHGREMANETSGISIVGKCRQAVSISNPVENLYELSSYTTYTTYAYEVTD